MPTPHVTVRHITTGHYHEGPGYHTWRPHGTEDYLLTLTLRGRGRFGHAGGDLITRRGDLVMLRPRTAADYGVERELQSWEVLWTHFQPHPHWRALLDWPQIAPGLMHLRAAGAVVRAFHDVHHQAGSALPNRTLFALNALERLLLLCDAVNPLRRAAILDDRVQTAIDYLCRHRAQKVRLGDVAAAAHLSVSRLCDLFKRQVGLPPLQFLEKQRLDHARELLENSAHSIKSIARQVGYENPFHFTFRFKKYAGQSPRAYRSCLAQAPTKGV